MQYHDICYSHNMGNLSFIVDFQEKYASLCQILICKISGSRVAIRISKCALWICYVVILFENTATVDFLVKINIIAKRMIDSIIISDCRWRIEPVATMCRTSRSKIKMISNTIMKFLAHIFFFSNKESNQYCHGKYDDVRKE
jgi:hypothetical protein